MADHAREMPEAPVRIGALAELRGATVRRLLALDQRGELCGDHIKIVADCLSVHERTVWRWVRQARVDGRCERLPMAGFAITEELRSRLALLGGNVSRLHRELVAEHRSGGPAAPSLATLHRAVRRDVPKGMRAGIRGGEKARRLFDVRLRRDKAQGHRNQVWEGDHVQVPVQVDVDGTLVKPWVTWFIDCSTCAVCGVAVTAGSASRESIFAALRAAVLRDERYGPFGGLPAAVRVDQGKDFLCQAVRSALGRFAVPVGDLPGYCPWLKGTVEELNGAVEEMFFRSLPRFVHGPTRLGGRPIDPQEPALTFAGFVDLLLDWVAEWNLRLPKGCLGGRTPEQAWLADPTPLDEVPTADLSLMMLEDDGRDRKVSTDGVRWRGRFYVGVDGWMSAHVGERVRLRYMPHHDHEIEVFDARTGRHLGSAVLADQASAEQVAAVLAARRRDARELEQTLKAAARLRRERYAAVTVARPPARLGALTAAQAETELDRAAEDRLRRVPRPARVPLPGPSSEWVLPRPTPDPAERGPGLGGGSGGDESGGGGAEGGQEAE